MLNIGSIAKESITFGQISLNKWNSSRKDTVDQTMPHND